ncbi:hypothetical protein HNY73_010371 [Argiope bruennichi]|uniref:Uncharacterized protein n=1 Tax=Argiope bruennichi TaxID=94029 RepID=A0A8T0F0W6_ARGBR|nr:hypothetical protein HNY73_010371 [Argiope bruennichi]
MGPRRTIGSIQLVESKASNSPATGYESSETIEMIVYLPEQRQVSLQDPYSSLAYIHLLTCDNSKSFLSH